MPRKKRGTRRISKAKRVALPVIIPQFQPINPSRQNVSELLSIIGAHANVKRVNKANMMKKAEVYGWLGAGDIQSVFKYCDEIVLKDDFIQLNKYPHGEISAAAINIISEFPDVLQTSAMEAHKQSVVDKENLFVEAAFAQNFIFTKEGTSRDAVNEQSLLYNNEPTNMFCFVRRDDNVILVTESECFDATRYFIQKIWQWIDGEVFIDFQPLLCDENFENSSGQLFAVLPDRKLRIAAELTQLQREYTTKFGNFEADKSLSTADWDEISTLNASISEAESFELVVDEENKKQDMSSTSIVNLSTVISEERFALLQEIKNKEKELRTEQEKFKYSLIPRENIAVARARFHEMLMKDTESATTSTAKKKLFTVLRDSKKGNM
uniref:UAS domain-containing protein n=1 Tax=Loa loa TaxID=7209 RepID=A0A1I7VI16_LOALO